MYYRLRKAEMPGYNGLYHLSLAGAFVICRSTIITG